MVATIVLSEQLARVLLSPRFNSLQTLSVFRWGVSFTRLVYCFGSKGDSVTWFCAGNHMTARSPGINRKSVTRLSLRPHVM